MTARCSPEKMDRTSIPGRLRIERCRLNLSQAEAASLVGVSESAWRGWEASAWRGWEANPGSPSARVLETFAEAGADVLFIITGSSQHHWLWGRSEKPWPEIVGQQWLETLDDETRRQFMLGWVERAPGVRRSLLYKWIEVEIDRRRHGYKRQLRAVLDILKVELG